MPSTSRHILYSLLVLAYAGETLSAQDYQSTNWQPVDQAVSDLDARAASQRYVEQGIGRYGQSGSMYRRTDTGHLGLGQPLSQTYQLRQPGYTAYLDQPDYLVLDKEGQISLNYAPAQDGMFRSMVPPNTFPRTMTDLGTGAASTPCRNPSRRSSMIEIVEKIAVNITIRTATPGKKYS